MPIFDIESEDGRKISLEGDVAPSPDEIDEIFAGIPKKQETPERKIIPPIGREPLGSPPVQMEKTGAFSPEVVGVFGGNRPKPTPEAMTALESPASYINTAVTGIGRPVNAALQDVGASIALTPEQGGNFYELATREEPFYSPKQLPYQRTLADISRSNPAVATVGKIAAGVTESAPLMAAFPTGVLGKIAAAGFAVDMAASGGTAAGTLYEELQKPEKDRDYNLITDSLSSLIQSGVLAPAAGVHAGSIAKTPRQLAIGELARQLKNEPIKSDVDTAANIRLGTQSAPIGNQRIGVRMPEDIVNPLAEKEVAPIVQQAFDEAKARGAENPARPMAGGVSVPPIFSAAERLKRERQQREYNPPLIIPEARVQKPVEGGKLGRQAPAEVQNAAALLEDMANRKPETVTETGEPQGPPRPEQPLRTMAEIIEDRLKKRDFVAAVDVLSKQPAEVQRKVLDNTIGVNRATVGLSAAEQTIFNELWDKVYQDSLKKGAKNATVQPEVERLRQQEHPGTDELGTETVPSSSNRPVESREVAKEAQVNTPPIRPGDTAIKIQQPDGTVIDAVTNGKDWDIGGKKVPNVGRVVDMGDGKTLWSDGPLREGEKILDSAEPPRQGTSPQPSSLLEGEQTNAAETPAAETIKSTAIRLPDGTIYTGKTPGDIHGKIIALLESDPKYSNSNFSIGEKDLGFLTSTGRFVSDRKEAAKIAGLDIQRLGAEHITKSGRISQKNVELQKAFDALDEARRNKDQPAIDKAIQAIESLQKKIRGSGKLQMGVPSAILDTALEAARLSLKAGKSVAEAIEAALKHIRYNLREGDWNEAKVKAMLEKELSGAVAKPVVSAEPAKPTATKTAGAAAPKFQIESPEGQKPRSYSARATVSEKIPEPVQEQIAKDKRSSYTPQSVNEVADRVKQMSDAELGALTPESDAYTLGKAELADRLFSKGQLDAGFNVVQEASQTLTRMGQIINQAKILNALKPENQVLVIDKGLQKAGKDPMTPDQRQRALDTAKASDAAKKRLDDATIEWKNNPTPENAKKADKALKEANDAALKLQKLTNAFQPRSTSALLKAILQGNLLTPISQSANLFGNLTFLPFRAASRTIAASMDILQSAVTGKKRQTSVGPISGTVQAAKGLAKGVSQMPSILYRGTGNTVLGESRAGIQPIQAWVKQFAKSADMPTEGGKITLKDRVNLAIEGTIGIPAEVMLRMLGAVDRPFREAAKARVTAEQLRLAKVPKSQWDFAQKFPELFFDKKTLEEIKNQSDYAIFQRQSKTLNMLTNWIASKGEFFDFAVATVAPYKVTPWNIIGEILSYNPLVAFGKAMNSFRNGDIRAGNMATGKMVVGSMLTAAGYLLYKNGLLSPSLDSRDESMKERILSGQVMPPNHVNITALGRFMDENYQARKEGRNPDSSVWAFRPGDKTVDIMRSGGLAGAFFYMTANVGRDLEKQPEGDMTDLTMAILRQSTLEQARFGMNQSFLSGVEGLLSAIKDGNPENYVKSWASTVTSIPLPNTLSALARATRQNKPDLSATSFKGKVENLFRNRLGVAGFDDYLPLKRGLWGEPLQETPKDRNALIYHLLDVTKGQQITDDPKAIEIYRLWRKTDDSRVIPTPPAARITFDSKTYPLTPKQHEELAIMTGNNRREVADSVIKNPNWHTLSDEDKIAELKSIYDDGLEDAKTEFWLKYRNELEAKPQKAGFKLP